ncbi:MAG: hypothetical protein NC489_44705, partial [Ruminococcus flavefaciens]|nr:hypothetical protein [Ruminococcus flavefaciens]
MKITYIKLENVAGIMVGSDKKVLEISFERSRNKIVSIQGMNGKGKALPNSTMIPTPYGMKMLSEINVGDYVFDQYGFPTKVLGVYPQGKKDVWEVEFSYGKSAKCCDGHLWEYWYPSHGIWRKRVAELKEIINQYGKDDYSFKPLKVHNNGLVNFTPRPVPVDPYTVGAFIGNGCLREFDLTMSSGTDEVPEKIALRNNVIAEKMKSNNYSYIFRSKDGKRLHSKEFFKGVPEILDKYSYEKYIPDVYLFNSEEVRWDILRGLIDTDGSVTKYKDRPERISITYSTTSEKLCDSLVFLVRSLGLNATIIRDKRSDKYTTGACFTVRIIGNIENYMDKICSVKEKYMNIFNVITSEAYRRKSNNATDYDFNYIRSARPLGYQEEMTCIMVDNPDHLFLTENFVVTHNTVLLSSLSPFASVTSLDERSSLSYIIPGKSGYKEIHYRNGDDEYIIKHYYKPTKESHTVKSYFQLNGEELNENGNVTSFLSLVEFHFGLTQEMMRLIRLGTNVSSFITLTPARRKEYIGKLIEEIDLYLKIYKKINEDIRVVKTLLSSNNQNLYNCHISDPVVEEEKLSKLGKDIRAQEKERDRIIGKIGKIESLIANNDIDDLRRKKQEAESSIIEFSRTEEQIQSNHLQDVTIDQLMRKRSDTSDKRLDIQSRINSYRISIDNTLKNIERIEISIKKITSDNDVQSLVDSIASLRATIQSTSSMIRDFVPLGSSSDEVYQMITKLSSFNQISNMIQTFGTRPIDVYLKLVKEGKSVDEWLKKQMQRTLSKINESDVRALFSQVFQDDYILSPNCSTEFEDCPYYRLHNVISGIKDKLDEDNYDDETLRYIQVISNNIDSILNEIDMMSRIRIPDAMREGLIERSILERMGSKLPFFDLSGLQEYLSILREHEIFIQNVERLKQYEKQFDMYQKSGVESHIAEIDNLRQSVEFYQKNIATLEHDLESVAVELEEIDRQIGLVTKYNDGKKYRKMVESTLESTSKILAPLESASKEKMELNFQLRQVTNLINLLRDQHRTLENKLNEYRRLLKEGSELASKNKDLTIILESVSTKKGIPVIYMKNYLAKI